MSGPFEGWDQPIIDENPEVTVAGAEANRHKLVESGDTRGHVVRINYRNYKGEERMRTIIPASVWWGATKWHPEEQWLLEAMDIEKGEMRDFALKDLGSVPQETIDELTQQEVIEEMGGPGATQEFTGKLMTEANDTILSQSHTIRKLRREKGELRNAVLLHAIGIVADLRNAQPPGDRFGALNEAMGAIDNYRFTFRGEEGK